MRDDPFAGLLLRHRLVDQCREPVLSEFLPLLVVRLRQTVGPQQQQRADVVVIDTAGVPGCRGETRLDRWVTIVRRLALAVEGSDTTIVLLTDANASRAMPLPTAMRIELERLEEDKLGLRVAKDRAGRVTGSCAIDLGFGAKGAYGNPKPKML